MKAQNNSYEWEIRPLNSKIIEGKKIDGNMKKIEKKDNDLFEIVFEATVYLTKDELMGLIHEEASKLYK